LHVARCTLEIFLWTYLVAQPTDPFVNERGIWIALSWVELNWVETSTHQTPGNVDFTSIFHTRPKKIGGSCQGSAASSRPSLPPDGRLCEQRFFFSLRILDHSDEYPFLNGNCSQFWE
jgi:hypothetical protein